MSGVKQPSFDVVNGPSFSSEDEAARRRLDLHAYRQKFWKKVSRLNVSMLMVDCDAEFEGERANEEETMVQICL